MKKLAIFCCYLFLSLNTTAQSINKVRYTVDTVYYDDVKIAIRRSAEAELNKYTMDGGANYSVSMSLIKLQEMLDNYAYEVKRREELKNFNLADDELYNISKASPKFDISLYEDELAFYKKMADPTKNTYSEAADAEYVKKAFNGVLPTTVLLGTPSEGEFKDFCASLMNDVQGYKFEKLDSSDKYKSISYANNVNRHVYFGLNYKMGGGDATLQIRPHLMVTKQSVTCDLLTLARIYDTWFRQTESPETLRNRPGQLGTVVYKGKSYKYRYFKQGESWTLEVYDPEREL